MGPQLCSCGNCLRMVPAAEVTRLQWGRNFAVAETHSSGPKTSFWSALQWGRNFAVAETVNPDIERLLMDLLQWGRNFAVAETRP